ncbi:MAG: hypothetical protein V1820_00310 [archaeon]
MVNLLVIDHHLLRTEKLEAQIAAQTPEKTKLGVPKADDYRGYVELVRNSLAAVKPGYALSDSDPDGICAIIPFMLSLPENERPPFELTRRKLAAADFEKWNRTGVKQVLATDWYPVYESDVSGAESVTILNPTVSGLSSLNCATMIMYDALAAQLPVELQETALALAAIGIVGDKASECGGEILRKVAEKYPQQFPGLAEAVSRTPINNSAVTRTPLGTLVERMWAPYVLGGDAGSTEAAGVLLAGAPFSLPELLDKESENPAAKYLRERGTELTSILAPELERFNRTATSQGPTILYVTQQRNQGVVQYFANVLSENEPESVILMGQANPGADGLVKYSARRIAVKVDLGKLAKEIVAEGNGIIAGGRPDSAGFQVPPAYCAQFEQEFAGKVESALASPSS